MAQMRDGAQNFQVTQFGLSAFVWDPAAPSDNGAEESSSAGRYLAHTFNFWIFPRSVDDRFSRRFLSQVASKNRQPSRPSTRGARLGLPSWTPVPTSCKQAHADSHTDT